MILDARTLFSDGQAITATAASTNVIDLGVSQNLGTSCLPLLIQVVEDFNNLTSLKVGYQVDTAENFGTATTLFEQTIPLANLKAGQQIAVQCTPSAKARYHRIYYTVTGTAPTTGKITAGFTSGVQNNSFYPAGYSV